MKAAGCNLGGFVGAAYLPVPLRLVNHAFSPLPEERLRSPCTDAAKKRTSTSVADVSWWRKRSAEL